jgi:pyrrolidone-carboxylate peptidase
MDAEGSRIQINQVSPIAAALTGGNTVTITGAGFQQGAIVYFGSQLAEKTVFESTTKITTVAPATEKGGSVAVTVVNPDGTQFTQIGGFTYITMENPDRAEVSGISPLMIIEEVETEITLRGRNLVEAYEKGLVALRCPSRLNLNISQVVLQEEVESGIDSLTFNVYVSASTPLEPNERIAIQVLASRRAEARQDLIVESSKQMFIVIPRAIPVPVAYTPALSTDKPTMFVVLGKNLDGCTLEFGDGVQTHLQQSDERSLYGIITVSDETAANATSPLVTILDKKGNPTGQYNLSITSSSELKQPDPLPPEDEFLYGVGLKKPSEETPAAGFTSDLIAVPNQMFLGPTAEDASVYDLRGELPNNLTFDSLGFEIQIFSYYIHLGIINEVYLFAAFDGGGEQLGSDISAKVGELFAVRGTGILFAARLSVTLHVTVMVIVTIDFPWAYGGFNEFPEEFPNAIGIVISGFIISVDIIIVASLLWALVKPDGSLRILLLIGLTIGVHFTISGDGHHLNFVPNFTHSVRFFSILPFADSLPCDGRFQLASDNGQTIFPDGYGGNQSFYFARSTGECCMPWNFNLQLVRFRSGQSEQVVQDSFQAYMCVTAQYSPNLMNIIITSIPPPQGVPPTLTMNIADSALLKAMAQAVDETGNPTSGLQDLRELGYDVDFFLVFPPALLEPYGMTDGNAYAIQSGQNLIRASISLRTSGGQTPFAFWSGAVLGFDIIRYLAQGEAPRVIAGALPLTVNANPNAIKVEPVLAYENVQNNQTVLVETPKITNTIQPPTDLWEVERYEPFETQREFVLAVKIDVPQNVTLPVTLDFKVLLPKLKKFVEEATTATLGVSYESWRFGMEHYGDEPKNFFTGNMVDGTQAAPVTASLTINTRPSPNDLIKVGNITIKPNVKEEDVAGSTPKKLVAPGKNVILKNGKGTNFLLTIPITCVPASGSGATVSFPKPELNLAIRNDETFEEYLRVFKQVQPLITGAGTYFNDFARGLYKTLSGGGGASVDSILETQGYALWGEACALVAPSASSGTIPKLDDRPLYWTRLRGIGAIRAYGKRNPNTINEASLKKFELASRGLDAADGGIKFIPLFIPPGARKVIITGFDPFGLSGGTSGTNPAYDNAERSNPSGLIALALNGNTIDVPNFGKVYIRTSIFPVRYFDFNKNIVENAVTPSLGSIVMIITMSDNSGLNYYDVERWAAKFRLDWTDNNNKFGKTDPLMPPEVPSGAEFLESTLPLFSVITTAESIEGPLGTAPFVIDQSYKTTGVTKDREQRRIAPVPPTDDPPTSIEPKKFRPEPLKTDIHAHQRATDTPDNMLTSAEGSGSSFLSNEVFYRTALKRNSLRPTLASGHLHVPSTNFNPNGTAGALLLVGIKKALIRFFNYGFRMSGPGLLSFPPTVINTTGAEIPMVVKNESTEMLKIGTIEVPPPFSVVLPSPLPITVNGGATATLNFKFAPTLVGSYNGKITLRESSGEILLTVDIRGSGIQNQPPPVITSFSPTVVPSGNTVTITGQYFTTTTMVKIGNMEVDYTVASDDQILINTEGLAGRLTGDYSIEDDNAVPPNGTGAITGYIKVTTAFGTATSSGTIRIVFVYS